MQALGCGLPGWQRAVQRLQADRKQMKQKLTAYSTEVAQTYALSLLPQLLISNGWLHAHRCAPLARCRHCRARLQYQPIPVLNCMCCWLAGCNPCRMLCPHCGQCGTSDIWSDQVGQHHMSAEAHLLIEACWAERRPRRRAQGQEPLQCLQAGVPCMSPGGASPC